MIQVYYSRDDAEDLEAAKALKTRWPDVVQLFDMSRTTAAGIDNAARFSVDRMPLTLAISEDGENEVFMRLCAVPSPEELLSVLQVLADDPDSA